VLGSCQGAELVVPVGFEGVGDQPIIRIDQHKAIAGQQGLVTRPFHLLAAKRVRLFQSGQQFGLHGQGQLERHRLGHLQQQLTHCLIDAGAGDLLTDRLAMLVAIVLADVVNHQPAMAFMIP